MIDYHVHSVLSGDASGSIADVCRAAVGAGLSEICFTEHVDFEPTDLCFGAFDHGKYAAEIDRARKAFEGRLVVRFGVEVDFQEKYSSEIGEFLEGKDFDYVVGSAHYANGITLENHERYFPGKTPEEAYTPYFGTALAAVESGYFDTLAHLDLCKRHGVRYFGAFDWKPFGEQIDAIILAIIERGMTLEINTSGLRQSPCDTYPGADILARYYDLGGRNITVGSDSHRIEDVGAGIECALRLAARIGFESIDTFNVRRRTTTPISNLLGYTEMRETTASDG